jgi:putative transposase
MPVNLKRYYGRGDLHFLTFSCYRRLPLLETVRARNLFVRARGQIRERYKFRLLGYVVMPEHVHLLISEPAKGTPSVALKALKQRVSRDLRKKKRCVSDAQLRLPFMNGSAALPRFWQTRFYDFNVYSAKKKREKLEYMHFNPVKRGLVKEPGAWRWSSFLFYARGESGLVSIRSDGLSRVSVDKRQRRRPTCNPDT